MTKVLVTDDDKDLQNFVARIAKEAGCDVQTADTGQDALDILSTAMVDIAFVDLNMPGLNGWQTVREIRRMPGGDSVKILVLSGHNTLDDIEEAHAAGCDRFLDKPITSQKVLDVLQQYAN